MLVFVGVFPALAGNIDVRSLIDSVTVYPDGATVTPYWSPYSRAPSPAAVTPYWSPYSRGPSPGTGDWSAYPPGGVPFWSTYTNRNAGGPYGAGAFAGVYGSSYARGVYAPRDGSISGSILFRLIGEFRRRLETYVRENPANLIHAHDWVTFAAAEGAASLAGVPWIAHFHSTEADRQPELLSDGDRDTAFRGAI